MRCQLTGINYFLVETYAIRHESMFEKWAAQLREQLDVKLSTESTECSVELPIVVRCSPSPTSHLDEVKDMHITRIFSPNYIHLQVKKNVRLTPKKYCFSAYKLVLSLQGTGMNYSVGGKVAVRPVNRKKDVVSITRFLALNPHNLVSLEEGKLKH